MNTVMTGSPTIVWEYYNGSTWSSLSGIDDETSNFTKSGMRRVSWTVPTDWATTDINDVTAYWVRARLSVTGTGTADADQIWTDKVFEDAHLWGEDEQSQLFYSGTAGFFTERNIANTEGVAVVNTTSATIAYLTSDGGTQWTPPVSRNITVTVKDQADTAISTAQVRIEKDSDGSLITSGTTSGLGVFTDSVFLSGDVDVDVVVRKSSTGSTRYIPVRRAATITSSGLSITIIMDEDEIAAV
jgi:hypothetical protein